jgi:hypothetical protein
MRLEDLFARVGYFAAQDAPADHHSALLALFDITLSTARGKVPSHLPRLRSDVIAVIVGMVASCLLILDLRAAVWRALPALPGAVAAHLQRPPPPAPRRDRAAKTPRR